MGETTVATTTELLNADSIEIRLFLLAWHENGRASFERQYTALDYDSEAYIKRATVRRRWICLDEGSGGHRSVERTAAVPHDKVVLGRDATRDARTERCASQTVSGERITEASGDGEWRASVPVAMMASRGRGGLSCPARKPE